MSLLASAAWFLSLQLLADMVGGGEALGSRGLFGLRVEGFRCKVQGLRFISGLEFKV